MVIIDDTIFAEYFLVKVVKKNTIFFIICYTYLINLTLFYNLNTLHLIHTESFLFSIKM